MKEILIDKIKNWTIESAEKFHDYKFRDIGEDRKYLWSRDAEGIFLWKDIKAVYFHKSGTIHKMSIWSKIEFWKYHEILFDAVENDISCRIERPIHYEYINEVEMEYSIVQRPGSNLGEGFLEKLMRDDINQTDILDSIEENFILFNHLKNINKKYNCPFPYPPKQFENNSGKFWGDFKYWKYSEEDYVKNYLVGVERFLPVLTDNYKLSLNTKLILEKINAVWKM